MRASAVFLKIFSFLINPCVILTVVLYLYPILFGCGFPIPEEPPGTVHQCILDKPQPGESRAPWIREVERAPFRLLAFGDPQLEGDTSLPNASDLAFPSLQALRNCSTNVSLRQNVEIVQAAILNLLNHDLPQTFRYYRKRLDLLGNDYYLAHIYRTVHWWTNPTHVTVLGDLLGSQWISDEEFDRRSDRFWNRIFRKAQRVDDTIMTRSSIQQLGKNPQWSERIINIAGNHDIGYAGDLTRARVDRFERAFGKVNWDIRFRLPKTESEQGPNAVGFGGISELGGPPELRLIVLNTMNMDGPALDHKLQTETYDFLNDNIVSSQRPVEDEKAATILLTHIPLYKEAGICVDWPYFDYGSSGIKEQNHLSPDASKAIIEGIFGKSLNDQAPAKGMGRQGIILTGHDHEGCDTYHHAFVDPTGNGSRWKAVRSEYARELANAAIPGLREITVRSMMGSFGGSAGLLSAWYDHDKSKWRFEYAVCPLGTQYIWWGVLVLQLVTLSMLLLSGVAYLREWRSQKTFSRIGQKSTQATSRSPGSVQRAETPLREKKVS